MSQPEPLPVLSFATWKEIVSRVWRGTVRHRVLGLAAEVAFFALFALPPLLLAVFSAIGFVGEAVGPDVTAAVRAQVLEQASRFVNPQTLEVIVAPTFDTLMKQGRPELLSLGVAFMLWSASQASDSLIDALRVAYALDQRLALWRRRGLALAYTVTGIVIAGVLLPLLVVGPTLGRRLTSPLGLQGTFDFLWLVFYWPFVVLAIVLLLTMVYHFAVPWKTPFLRDVPGAVFAMLLWVGGSAGLREYARWTFDSSSLYGSLAAPMIILLWLFFTAFSVLMGAELNAAIESMWPTLSRKDKKQVLRKAVHELEAAGEEVAPVSETGRPS